MAGAARSAGTANDGKVTVGRSSAGSTTAVVIDGVRIARAIGPAYAMPNAANPIAASQKRIARWRRASRLIRSGCATAVAADTPTPAPLETRRDAPDPRARLPPASHPAPAESPIQWATRPID